MKIVVLGDIHFPFFNKQALKKVINVIKETKPDYVIQVGDLYDQYAFSRFSKKIWIEGKKELSEGRELAEGMWAEIGKHSKNLVQLLGNHDIRALNRLMDKIPEGQELFSDTIYEYYRFPKVKTIEDDREIFNIGEIHFHHGYLPKLGDHMKTHGRNMVVGHSHTGGVVYAQTNGKTLFELNAGYLADETAEPLRYNPTRNSRWTLGYGVIDEQGPRFVAL